MVNPNLGDLLLFCVVRFINSGDLGLEKRLQFISYPIDDVLAARLNLCIIFVISIHFLIVGCITRVGAARHKPTLHGPPVLVDSPLTGHRMP